MQTISSWNSSRGAQDTRYGKYYATLLFSVAAIFLTSPLSGQTSKYIALTDQKAGDPRILVMDYGQKDWSADNPKAVIWSWRPADSGIPQAGWRLPTEAKLRNNVLWGGQWVAVCDSAGFMAVVSYPGKEVKWSLNAGSSSNVHGIELLPNGNVAAAASTGGWVRIYTSSQGPSSANYVQYNLPDAHNVLWDPQMQVLWALGGSKLVQLKIGGTVSEPTLTAVETETLSAGSGHDVAPKYGDPTKLMITSGDSTWFYDKVTKKETLHQRISGYKSINNQTSTGQMIETRPHASCKEDSWCTDVIEFFSPDDTRTRSGAAVYRARIWNADYQ